MKLMTGNGRFDGPDNPLSPLTIVVARGQDVRFWIVKPWMIRMCATALAGVAVAGAVLALYLLAPSTGTQGEPVVLQARMQRAYEERISSLRAELNRVATHQSSEQQALERKIMELLSRQERLTERHSWLGPLLERAEQLNASSKPIPVPTPRPQIESPAEKKEDNGIEHVAIAGNAFASVATPKVPWPIRKENPLDNSNELFQALDQSLQNLESDQVERVDRLTEETYRTIEAIGEALDAAGISISTPDQKNAGGPLLPVSATLPFEDKARELDEALSRLEALKRKVRRIPIAHPVPGAQVTSSFGMRRDPLLGRTAYHAGMDFRASPGSPVRAAASGIVVEAGWNGGYGRMVEVDHGNGIRTRYAHLSNVLVKIGDRIDNGGVIGRVGSSGRSTGPHLHYEIRQNHRPINPRKLIKAGQHLAELL